MNNSTSNNTNRNRNRNGKPGPSLIVFLFGLQCDMKMFHWQTRSYATHVETGKLFDAIIDLSDQFIEQYMGVYGRPRMPPSASVRVRNVSRAVMVRALRTALAYLGSSVPPDSHLQNIRDEMAGEIAKALYLLTMR